VAVLADAKCRLQDRLRTALEFLEKADRKPVEELQIAEAAGHLWRVDPAEIVPAAWDRSFLAGLVLSLAAGGLIACGWLGPASRPVARAALGSVSPGGQAGMTAARTNGGAGRQGAHPFPQAATGPADQRPMAPRDPHWQPAPAARVAPARASLGTGPTLEEILAEAARAGAAASNAAVSAETVAASSADEGELLPLEHRRMLRSYFESIRPKEEPFDQPPSPSGDGLPKGP
jgi:hypothetical protein